MSSTAKTQCSTRNNSDISEKHRKRIRLLHERHWSVAQQLLRKYEIPLARVANYADVSTDTASRVLHLTEFMHVAYITVLRVRAATEITLNREGYPRPGDTGENELFADFDRVAMESL
jgi:hypothetical protein